MALEARPTTYEGTKMRSRLEASWAAAFDQIGMVWQYEPLAFADAAGQWLPDFRVGLPGALTAYVECKPRNQKGIRDLILRMAKTWASEPDAMLLVLVGNPAWDEELLAFFAINEPRSLSAELFEPTRLGSLLVDIQAWHRLTKQELVWPVDD